MRLLGQERTMRIDSEVRLTTRFYGSEVHRYRLVAVMSYAKCETSCFQKVMNPIKICNTIPQCSRILSLSSIT